MDRPFFSIIVVSYQAGKKIKYTIESILAQNFDNYEIIVKDGDSSDDTLEWIPISSKIKIYSQRDSGIYDGMNEAIKYANGKYLCFLNCGDCLADETVLRNVFEYAELQKESVIFYGDYLKEGVVVRQPSKLTDFKLFCTAICHQTMFFHISAFERFGFFNTNIRISADYCFTVKSFIEGMPYVHIPLVICNYESGGVSETKEGINRRKAEYKEIVKIYFSKTKRIKYELILFFTLRPLRRLIVSDDSPIWLRKFYRGVVNRVKR